jgi:membrane protease YdiL (CAAX protease family)
MTIKQLLAIIAPVVLVAMMVPIFRYFVRVFDANWRIGWYFGLVLYWILWGGLFSYLMLGRTNVLGLIRPQRLTIEIGLLVLIPLIGAGLYRLVPGMDYQKPALWVFILLLSTNLGNGFFEELLWRGVYLELFPAHVLWGWIWPCLWFALWHYAPGSIAPDGNPLGLMIGSGIMGFYLVFLARHTGTIWWTIIAHAIGGFIMIL